MNPLLASQITDAIQGVAAAQARYEITADRLHRTASDVNWDIRPTTTEIEVAKERLNTLLQDIP